MDLKQALEDELRLYHFIQLGALRHLITPKSVQAYLKNSGLDLRTVDLQEIVSKALKLFAVLVLLERADTITKYLSNGFSDKDFPILKESDIPNITCVEDKRALLKKQWQVPIVLQRSRNLDLPAEFIRPFLQSECRDHGSFAIVYKVLVANGHLPFSHDSSTPFAWKEIRERKQGWDIMLREVETLLAREHQNIIPLLASWTHQFTESEYPVKTLNLLFPWSSMNLEQWLNLTEPPSGWRGYDPKELKDYIYRSMMSLCDGVAHLHKNIGGFISSHHDLKPANILLFEDKTWKIIDFGRTHLIRISVGSDTEGRHGLGSFVYHPPEYWDVQGGRAEVRHGRAFDIWALGCIFVELATIAVHGWSSKALGEFREMRKGNLQPAMAFNNRDPESFHNNMSVVKQWMAQLEERDGSANLTAVLQIATTMLDNDPIQRPLSWEVYLDLHELLHPNNTVAEKEVEIKDKVQPPNRHRSKGEKNPLQRACARGDKLRVEHLLRTGWADYPVNISSLETEGNFKILKLIRIARLVKDIRWLRALKLVRLKHSETSTLTTHHAKYIPQPYRVDNVNEYRGALGKYREMKLNHPKKRHTTFSVKGKNDADLRQDDQGMNQLHRICQADNYWMASSFLDKTAPESLSEIVTHEDVSGRLPLHYAASNGSENMIRLLLESFSLRSNALVAWRDKEGRTPLHIAAQNNQVIAIKPLVEAHVNRMEYLRMQDEDCLTACELARKSGNKAAEMELARLECPLIL